MNLIDLRSDTVTKPTPEMRRAMMEAEVGDDVYGEDPTVNRLEEQAAEVTGKQAALFVPTGTMGNTIAVKLLTEHGQEVICDSRGHVLDYELAMVAWFSGCVVRAIPTADGILSWDQVKHAIKPVNPHTAPTGMVEIENTHNMAGGTVYPVETIKRSATAPMSTVSGSTWTAPAFSTRPKRRDYRCARFAHQSIR
jgi:threonine aldolase